MSACIDTPCDTYNTRKGWLWLQEPSALAKRPKRPYDLQRFAAEDEGRTEPPTERRQRKERERGNVVRSQEVVSAALLLGTVMVLFVAGVYMFDAVQKVFQNYLDLDFRSTQYIATPEGTGHFIYDIGLQVGKIIGPLLLAAVLTAIIANVSQFGFLFSAYPLSPRWDKIRPDFRRILPGRRTLFNLMRVLLQVVFIALAAYIITVDDYVSMLKAANMGLSQAILLFARVAFKLLIVAALILSLISVIDFLYQRYEYTEKLKTTVSEAKRERKDEEGDPLIRQRQRDRAYDLRKQQNIIQDATKADVVITNPTHFAVGLKYELGIDQAPVVIAKGADHLAFIIRNIAREHQIPIEENPPLARALFETVETGQEIPNTLYRAVSLIFSRLDRFRHAKTANA